MSKLAKFELTDFQATRVIGKEIKYTIEEKEKMVKEFWDQCFKDGSIETLEKMTDDLLSSDHVGWIGDFNPNTGEFVYIVGMFMKPDTKVPTGYVYRDLPSTKVGIGQIKGKEDNGEVYKDAFNLTYRFVELRGYTIGESFNYSIEVFNQDRFREPLNNGSEEVILDYYIPCIMKL